ncbi:MAG: glucodextranase DOMON-like domain-containing protein, partial [Candidatus Omnitrophota bacterium]|nr:glucodextranase DOMON-like domain-containing protein [Candidatus Omnitrophota bacterium]
MIFLFLQNLSSAETEGSVAGHTINVDGSIGDWIGTAPAKPNTAVIDKGEYIWKDETGDDTGNGKYTYPTNKAFAKGADLLEFRVTWDSQNVYFLIKRVRPGDWWIPYCLIGIDEDGARGMKKGAQILAQGDINYLEADTGAFGELKVMPTLACEYVIGIAGTYKGRIWDSDGKLVAKTFGRQTDTKGFLIKDSNWSA